MSNTNTRSPDGAQSSTASRGSAGPGVDTDDTATTGDTAADDDTTADRWLPSTLSVTDSGAAADTDGPRRVRLSWRERGGRTTVFCRAVGARDAVTLVTVDHVRRVELSQRGDTTSELRTGRAAERRLPRWLESALPDDVRTTREVVA
jgi:hypothetical protein